MLLRNMFRGYYQLKNETSIIKKIKKLEQDLQNFLIDEKIMTASVFYWKGNIFFYYECIGEDIEPLNLMVSIHKLMIPMPDGRYWIRMMDIFHYNTPASTEHWKRKNNKKNSFARINILRPDMYSSYIFYHYQLQEEFPGIGDKYGIIGINDNLMFFYSEEPKNIEEVVEKGKLETKNSPRDMWKDLMKQHFEPWDDTEEAWRAVEKIIQV